MRAKMQVTGVEPYGEGEAQTSETLHLSAVAKSEGYGDDGADENNTFAKFTPTADAHLQIANPELFGKFAVGDEYYVDFTKVES